MKNILSKLIAILSILLTLLIILVGAYIGVPSFKSKVNSLIPQDNKKVTAVKVDPTVTGTGTDPGTSSSITQLPSNDIPTDNIPSNTISTPAPVIPSSPASAPIPDPTPEESSAYISPDADTGYVKPSESELNIPKGLQQRTGGFEPVTPDLNTISDEEAEALESSLDYGNTGEGLDFDPLFYPYYHMLDDKSKSLYRQIYANACDLYSDFKAVESDATPAQVKNAFTAVCNDHPELFFMDTKFSAAFKGNGDCIEIKLCFNDLANNIDETKAQFESAAESVKNASSGSPFEMEKAAHDALSQMNTYSLMAPHNQSAYSALNEGSTVCAGYSRAMQYVMQLAGIPCYYCSGYAGENHAWNIICLDDEFYNLDVTWDDTDDASVCNYDWFNKTDADYGTTHIRRDLSVYLPPCNGTKYRYNEERPAEEPIQGQEPQTYIITLW